MLDNPPLQRTGRNGIFSLGRVERGNRQMRSASSSLDRFHPLKQAVMRCQRIAGTYILEAAAVPRSAHDGPAQDGAEREAFLRTFAAEFGFAGPGLGDAEWKDAEVFREEARQVLVEKLVGGGEIGHSRWDVEPAQAEAFTDEFLSLFSKNGRFFCSVIDTAGAQWLAPYARPDFADYIFGGGCVAIDEQLAAVFWMLDND
jgi:hypothetical protein